MCGSPKSESKGEKEMLNEHIASEMTNLVLTNKSHILIEMGDLDDRQFTRAWLPKVANAQRFWRKTLRDPALERHARVLTEFDIARLGEFLGEWIRRFPCLRSHDASSVMLVDLNETGDFGAEFAILVQLGFFVLSDQYYKLSIPETVTLEAVQQAALKLASTATGVGDRGDFRLERLLHVLAQEEVEAQVNVNSDKAPGWWP
jgi:hypothetical protein